MGTIVTLLFVAARTGIRRTADAPGLRSVQPGGVLNLAPPPAEPAGPRVAVFGPDPLLSVTVEARGGEDDLHVHPAGQGVWVARMLAEMGAAPVLCGLIGGETGTALRGLLERMPIELRLVPTQGASGAYLVDRRHGERQALANSPRPAPARHELDDLVAVTCGAALDTGRLVVCNPFPAEGFPLEVYETVAAAAEASGVELLVDLSSPRLERVLPYRPYLVKLNDWELAAYVSGPVDGPRALEAAARLQHAGAQNVVVTRAGDPILVVADGAEPYEILPPRFERGFREGCGDSMMGALAAVRGQGGSLGEALVVGAGAGAANFLRHGLGTGRREAVLALARHVVVAPRDPIAPSGRPVAR